MELFVQHARGKLPCSIHHRVENILVQQYLMHTKFMATVNGLYYLWGFILPNLLWLKFTVSSVKYIFQGGFSLFIPQNLQNESIANKSPFTYYVYRCCFMYMMYICMKEIGFVCFRTVITSPVHSYLKPKYKNILLKYRCPKFMDIINFSSTINISK